MEKYFLIVCFLVCMLVSPSEVDGRSSWRTQQKGIIDDNEPLEKHQRPQYLSGDPPLHGAHAPKSRDRDLNLLRAARRYVGDHPEIVPAVYDMISEIQSAEGQDLHVTSPNATFTCPEYGMYPCDETITSDDDAVTYAQLIHTWRDLVANIADDSEQCTNCVSLLTTLKAIGCAGLQWEQIKPIIIDFCTENLPFEPEICEGVITIQGDHVFCILLQADPTNFCESMNDCVPSDPRTGRSPVSERTPWAVKERLMELGEWPPARAAGAGRTPEGDNYVKIAGLADIHLQMEHAVGSATECLSDVCCLEELPGEGSARYWGEYTCNLPPHTLQLFMDRVQGIHPDFVIYAGDSPPHTMHKETEASQMNCSAIVADMMSKAFGPDLRVYPAIGNHEMYPTNLYSRRLDETKRQTQRFTEIWSKLAGFDVDNNQTFAEMSHYSMTLEPDHPKLRIMTINTELDWYIANFYATLNEQTAENAEHKQWVNDTLRLAREAGEKVIVISHHPVGGGDGSVRSARWWEEIAVEYGDVIVLHVSGHTHSDQLKLSFDPESMKAMSVNRVAPSTNSKTYINPSLVMYYLDPVDYTLMEYESFHLEIKDQQQSIVVPPAIRFGYSAREEYEMPDLSPASHSQLVLRFTEDDELFQKYHQNKNSHAEPASYCNYACRVSTICNIWFPDFSEARECIDLAPPAPPTTTTITTTTTSPGNSVGIGTTLTASFVMTVSTTILAMVFI